MGDKMKKMLLIACATIGLSSCTKFDSQTILTPIQNPGVVYHSYDMTLSSTTSTFTHIATVNPHVLNNEILQATGFEKQNNYSFIVYNTEGNTIRGGLDIISLATLNTPVVVSSMVSENSEYAEVKIKGNNLFMVGQKKGMLKNDALLTVVDVTNKSAPVVVGELLFTNGYYATSIDIQGNKAYITVPNEGVKVVNITNPASPTLISTEGSTQGNTLFNRRLGSKNIMLGGSSNHNISSNNASTTVLQNISSQVQEAPARFTIAANTLYTNGGNTGLTILDKMNTSAPILKSSTPVGGRGNGIAVDSCKQAYLAQGDLGLLVVDVANLTNPQQLGRFDYTGSQEDHGSANNVFLMKSAGQMYVFVSDGLGGVKIVKVTSTQACANDDDDEDEDDKCDDDNHSNDNGLVCKVYNLSSTQPTSLPNFSALTPVGTFTTDKLNVQAQTWANSFPLFPTPLKVLKEWYGVVCKGVYESPKAEAVKFYLGSDDGSKLYLDNALVIDNDGLHSPATVTATVNMQKRDYDVRVEYYQGPQTEIQLELQLESNTIVKKYMEGFSH